MHECTYTITNIKQYSLVPHLKDPGGFVKVDQQNPPDALQLDLQSV